MTVNLKEPGGSGSTELSYTISSADEWDEFASLVNKGNTFSGVTVKLAADISVTAMVGTIENNGRYFMGTFDGNGHTITFSCNTGDSYIAPFRYVEGATFRDLTVAGTIQTSGQFAGGIVADAMGSTSLVSCRSKVDIESSRNGSCEASFRSTYCGKYVPLKTMREFKGTYLFGPCGAACCSELRGAYSPAPPADPATWGNAAPGARKGPAGSTYP